LKCYQLSANKMRTGLTILGIVIGVAAVIAMLSIGQGAQNSITSSINSIGSNIPVRFFRVPRQIYRRAGATSARNIKPLT